MIFQDALRNVIMSIQTKRKEGVRSNEEENV